jgi:rubredoxin
MKSKGDISDKKCPLCGRYYTIEQTQIMEDAEPKDKYETLPLCARCVLTSPEAKTMIDPAKLKSYETLIKRWDAQYQKKLQKKIVQKMIEAKKVFRERKEYTIYFIPYCRETLGLEIETHGENDLPVIHKTKEYAKDLKEAVKERKKITFPADLKAN